MALVQNWDDAGDGMMIASSTSRRAYEVNGENGYFEKYTEEVTSVTTKWFALSLSAAMEAINRNVQPNDALSEASWSMNLESGPVGAYSVQREITTKILTLIENSLMPAPTISPDGQPENRTEMPFNCTIVAASQFATLKYRVMQKTASGTWTDPDWIAVASKQTTVTGITSTYPGTDANQLRVRVEAVALVDVDGTVTTSGTAVMEYRDTMEGPYIFELSATPEDDGGYNERIVVIVAAANAGTPTPTTCQVWSKLSGPGGRTQSWEKQLDNFPTNHSFTKYLPTNWPDGAHSIEVQIRSVIKGKELWSNAYQYTWITR